MHVGRTDGFPIPYRDRVILFDGAYDSMRSQPSGLLPGLRKQPSRMGQQAQASQAEDCDKPHMQAVAQTDCQGPESIFGQLAA